MVPYCYCSTNDPFFLLVLGWTPSGLPSHMLQNRQVDFVVKEMTCLMSWLLGDDHRAMFIDPPGVKIRKVVLCVCAYLFS